MVVPESYPNPISTLKIHLSGHMPTLPYTPQLKQKTIILYQGGSQMNICLKTDAIIWYSEQVDEYLSQLILALP